MTTPVKPLWEKTFADIFSDLGIPGLEADDFQHMTGMQLTKEANNPMTMGVKFTRYGNDGVPFKTYRRYVLVVKLPNHERWERID